MFDSRLLPAQLSCLGTSVLLVYACALLLECTDFLTTFHSTLFAFKLSICLCIVKCKYWNQNDDGCGGVLCQPVLVHLYSNGSEQNQWGSSRPNFCYCIINICFSCSRYQIVFRSFVFDLHLMIYM